MPSIWRYRRKEDGTLELKDGMDLDPDVRIRFDGDAPAYSATLGMESWVVRLACERLEMAKADAEYLERWLKAKEDSSRGRERGEK